MLQEDFLLPAVFFTGRPRMAFPTGAYTDEYGKPLKKPPAWYQIKDFNNRHAESAVWSDYSGQIHLCIGGENAQASELHQTANAETHVFACTAGHNSHGCSAINWIPQRRVHEFRFDLNGIMEGKIPISYFEEVVKAALKLMNGSSLKQKGYQCPQRASRACHGTGVPQSQIEALFAELVVIVCCCISGKNRSPILVAALLLAYYPSSTIQEVYTYLKGQRPIVDMRSDGSNEHRDPVASRGCFAPTMSASTPCQAATIIFACKCGKNRSPHFAVSLILKYYEHGGFEGKLCDS